MADRSSRRSRAAPTGRQQYQEVFIHEEPADDRSDLRRSGLSRPELADERRARERPSRRERRGGSDQPRGCVRAWSELDAERRQHAVLTPERAIQLDGALVSTLTGDGIAALAERLPARRDGD